LLALLEKGTHMIRLSCFWRFISPWIVMEAMRHG
jgi:hypothetical protein